MRIDYLADHLHLAPTLAAWHHAEWAGLLPGWTYGVALADLRSHTGRRQIPTTVVALDGETVIGSASLLADDLDDWKHLRPWLASVFVVPELRGRGVGRQLVARVLEEARGLGEPAVYLWTARQRMYYERLGWSVLEQSLLHGRAVTIMRYSQVPE